MPRPILRPQETKLNTDILLNTRQAAPENKQLSQVEKMKLDRLLRKPRSKAYMEAMHKLDAGGHVHNQKMVEDIVNTIKQEFPEVELAGILLGYVAVCYLGKPYEVHTLDMTGNIIEHYKEGEPLPGGLEKARSLAVRGGYEFIEVYVDCCRAIGAGGSVSVITN
ncbi:MAG: hypothetical protein Q4C52_05110 [Eubacteriales bacterium]|nr:hypothetical protein [Eubacteriales bacterium]